MLNLLEAACYGWLLRVKELVRAGSSVAVTDSWGRTPLILAARCGSLEVVRYLVNNGAAVDVRSSDNWTPLMWAAKRGDLDMIRFLEEQGLRVDPLTNDGHLLLMLASRGNHWDVVRFFMNQGAFVDPCGSDGRKLLMRAARQGLMDVVQILVEKEAAEHAINNEDWKPVMTAITDGHFDMVRTLMEGGTSVDARGSAGWSLLKYAASSDNPDIAHFLVECGAAVNARDSDGWTPLMRAANSGDLDMVRILVKQGAAVDIYGSDGRTLLMLTPISGHFEVVRFLVECGAAVDACDSEGRTMLIWAANVGHLELLSYLVEHGATVDASDNDGWTPLMWAACSGILDLVCYLVEHKADVNLLSKTGDNALSIATKFDRQEIVHFLLFLVRNNGRRSPTENCKQVAARSSTIPSTWLISPFELEVEPFIEAGNTGGNYRGKWLDADVVVKLFVAGATSVVFVDEVRLWHQLRHPNILKLYGVCNSNHHIFVCEYASKGSLSEYLNQCDGEQRTPWKFLYETALGLEYLHERKIVHDNLHGNNILIGSDGLAKLSGFRLRASSSDRSWYASAKMVRWTAPEILMSKQASLASDVYSLGMCIIEAVLGKVPYDGRRESTIKLAMKYEGNGMIYLNEQLVQLTNEQRELVLAMCRDDPSERLQMPSVVNKLDLLMTAEIATRNQHSKSEQLITFDEFYHGSLWIDVRTLIQQSENKLYHHIFRDLNSIYNIVKNNTYPWSVLRNFHDLLAEFRNALNDRSQQNRVYRLSATRARDYSVQGLHRRISQLLQLVDPLNHYFETRDSEWKRLCREQIEVFVSEASEAYMLLSSVNCEKDRSALVSVLRSELRNIDGKYTDKQLVKLQKSYDDIVSISLKDVHLATTPEWFIPWFELEMNENEKPLGLGGFGSVTKAKWLDSEVVVKKLEIDPKDEANSVKKREMRKMFEREVDIWFGLSHPHVVRLFGACHVGRPFFVCELAPNGTLDKYLCDHPEELWSKLREAALGVQYLHARGIVHGDLKGNNILIGSDGKAKVTDFGLSGVFGDDSTDVILSEAMHWVAPECMQKKKQKPTFASDIYSLGMCIVEALRVTNGDKFCLPWGNLPNSAVKFHVTQRHLLPSRPQNCSDEAWMMIERMCKSVPADRTLIVTVVDELEKLAGRDRDHSSEADHNNVQLSPSFAVDTLAEMKPWFDKGDSKSNYEGGVLKKIYKLLWDRLEHVSTQINEITITSDFNKVVQDSRVRTHETLSITGVILLIKFTELALRGYALHRSLDKFMIAHAVATDSSPLHDWTSACNKFMEVNTSLTQTNSASATEEAVAL